MKTVADLAPAAPSWTMITGEAHSAAAMLSVVDVPVATAVAAVTHSGLDPAGIVAVQPLFIPNTSFDENE